MFRTEVKVTTTDLKLGLNDDVVTIGSCFAQVIGQKLQENKAPVLVNPFGTIFNPVSVATLLSAASGKPQQFEQSLVQRDGIWYNYNLHSSLSSPDRQALIDTIQDRIDQTATQLKAASILVVTLGTAVGYELLENGDLVANCHKLPAKLFQKKLLVTDTIIEALAEAFEQIRSINPVLQVVLTVSPVRHVKETLELNSVSKAMLRVACHELVTKYDHVHYFPAFEIMLDDLRDYRFYGEDMLHPTTVAEDYIWEKFVQAYYTSDFREFTQHWAKLKRAISHRPFHPDSSAHQAFLKNTLQQLEETAVKYNLDVTDEKANLLKQISTK